jgi:hypothetical protein
MRVGVAVTTFAEKIHILLSVAALHNPLKRRLT